MSTNPVTRTLEMISCLYTCFPRSFSHTSHMCQWRFQILIIHTIIHITTWLVAAHLEISLMKHVISCHEATLTKQKNPTNTTHICVGNEKKRDIIKHVELGAQEFPCSKTHIKIFFFVSCNNSSLI